MALELAAKPLSKLGGPSQSDLPALNAHEFLFSASLVEGSAFHRTLPKGTHGLPRPVAPQHPIYFSAETGRGLSHKRTKSLSLRLAAALAKLDLGKAPSSIPGLDGEAGAGQFTILIHLSNSLAFPVIALGGLAGCVHQLEC